ncbi:hypothetical protein HXX76_010503 [Chlamydomonas incerta]|uniref:Uncharacterized protein n=1 Tax=Chlamydomonas incerta TaxID=51695 RepID=A0A835SRG6_CHLIN|nr:hypothetical protein HXX76_010503 [Chlamydomonas incerta]|eukprot:KAG2428358.1 hypothetical protein HXX76_010503 [Chlamydomonas incerta]
MAVQPWPGAAFVAHWGCTEPWRALSRWQRLRLLCLAASSHHPPSLDAALAQCGTVNEADALASAAAAGDLQACRRLYESEGCRQDERLVGTAAGLSGSLPVCQWLAEAMPETDGAQGSFLLPAAISAGHERVVEWAMERLGNRRFWNIACLEASCTWQYYEPWGRGLVAGMGPKQSFLLAAAASPTPDWAQNVGAEARGLASLRYLLLEDPAGLAQGRGAAAADWSSLFRHVAVDDADLPLLRVLHEQLGAAIDLVAVARGGSEEALSWAVAALEAAGQAPQPLSCSDLQVVLSSGNWVAADWLARHALAPPKQEILEQMRSGASSIRILDLQLLVGMRGGQDRAQALGRLRWLAELAEAVGGELAGATGGAPGEGAAAMIAPSL